MLLLTDLTSAPDDKVLVSNTAKKYLKKYRRYMRQYSKSITDTISSNTNTALLTTLAALVQNGR